MIMVGKLTPNFLFLCIPTVIYNSLVILEMFILICGARFVIFKLRQRARKRRASSLLDPESQNMIPPNGMKLEPMKKDEEFTAPKGSRIVRYVETDVWANYLMHQIFMNRARAFALRMTFTTVTTPKLASSPRRLSGPVHVVKLGGPTHRKVSAFGPFQGKWNFCWFQGKNQLLYWTT